jgi:hypothetical protein
MSFLSNFNRIVSIGLLFLNIGFGSINAMETAEQEFIYEPIINEHSKYIKDILKQHFDLTDPDTTNCITLDRTGLSSIPKQKYECIPNDQFNFTDLVYDLYNSGYKRGSKVANQENNIQHIKKKNKIFISEIEEYKKANNELISQKEALSEENIKLKSQQQTQNSTIQPGTKKTSLLWNNLSYGALGAGILGACLLFKKIIQAKLS